MLKKAKDEIGSDCVFEITETHNGYATIRTEEIYWGQKFIIIQEVNIKQYLGINDTNDKSLPTETATMKDNKPDVNFIDSPQEPPPLTIADKSKQDKTADTATDTPKTQKNKPENLPKNSIETTLTEQEKQPGTTPEPPVLTETPTIPVTPVESVATNQDQPQKPEPSQPVAFPDHAQGDQEKISFAEPRVRPAIEPQVEQPKLPTTTELTVMESQQKLDQMLGKHDQQPTEFLSVNGYQPPETKMIRAEMETPATKPLTDSQMIEFSNDVTFDKFQETVSDTDQPPTRIDIQPNYIDLGNEEFGGDTIIHQFNQDTQVQMLDAAATVSDAALVVVGTEFPAVGVVISAIQGAETGFDNALKGGATPYEAVWNMTTGAITNTAVGIVGGKIFGAMGGKITNNAGHKIVGKTIDYGGAVVSDNISGTATDATTTYHRPSDIKAGTYGDDTGGLYINPALNLVK